MPSSTFKALSLTTAPSIRTPCCSILRLANRNIEQHGVRIDGAVVSDKALKVELGTYVIQVGKRRFAKVTLKK